MPIILPPTHPAAAILNVNGVSVAHQAPRGAIRVGLLNLMPDKLRAELQFARQLGRSGMPVELVLTKFDTYRPRHATAHVETFYSSVWTALREGLHALIVTGAPVEQMPFAEVAYWDELAELFAQVERAVPHRLYVCWAAQAALFARHGVPKIERADKAFGIFEQHVAGEASDLLDGLGQSYPVPVSRHTQTRPADLRLAGLRLLSACPSTGAGLVESADRREVYSFNHFEYDPRALADEYRRDRAAGLPIAIPSSYFPGDDPSAEPVASWATPARRFFANWLWRVARSAARSSASVGTVPFQSSGENPTPAHTFGSTSGRHKELIEAAIAGD